MQAVTRLEPTPFGQNLALFSLVRCSGVELAEPVEDLERAFAAARELAQALPQRKDGVAPEEAEVDWGLVLASAQVIVVDYLDRKREPARGAELAPLSLAVDSLIAGTETDSGLELRHRKQWALLALVLGGMLDKPPYIAASRLPELQALHPALLAAAGVASAAWTPAASPGAGVEGPYADLGEEVVYLRLHSSQASPERAQAAYERAMLATLEDPEATSYESALLGYARGALDRLIADWRLLFG